MLNKVQITDQLYWIGGNDRRLALFEGTFPIPKGISYNSYLLLDEKTVLFDTVDVAVADVFLEGLERLLDGRKLDYLVIHHMEPDHSASFLRVLEKYPDVCIVGNGKTAQMLKAYFSLDLPNFLTVKEGDTLSTGAHTLKFIFAPMVHWPEVMFTFDERDGILFSADAFGTFGALGGSLFADECDFERDYLDEARRYYTNIVGKYGVQVQSALKKVSEFPIRYVCPLHGPVWRTDFAYFLEKYLCWSSYQAEEKGVALFYASIYGHTQNGAEILASALAKKGVPVKVYDVSVTDVSYLVSEAFRYSHAVFASPTYNGGIFVRMENFLSDLKAHNFQNKKYALMENGSWAPMAGKLMNELLSPLKNMQKIGDTVKILSAVNDETRGAIEALAEQIAQDFNA